MKQIIFPTCVMGMNRIHRWCVAKNVGLNWSHLCSVCISFSKDLIMYQWNYPPWNWHSTWKDGIPKGNRIVFQPSIFSCLVSGRVIRRPESAWLANILCRIQTVSIDPNPSPKSKIQNPKSKIQNPKSEIQNPKSKIQNPKSEIQNPKSKRGRLGPPQKERRLNWSKIQNPKSKIRNPKSKIQNPKSKIRNPKSKIQNPKSKIRNPKSKIQNPKSEIQNPKSKIQNPNGPFGVWILDLVGPGPGAMAM